MPNVSFSTKVSLSFTEFIAVWKEIWEIIKINFENWIMFEQLGYQQIQTSNHHQNFENKQNSQESKQNEQFAALNSLLGINACSWQELFENVHDQHPQILQDISEVIPAQAINLTHEKYIKYFLLTVFTKIRSPLLNEIKILEQYRPEGEHSQKLLSTILAKNKNNKNETDMSELFSLLRKQLINCERVLMEIKNNCKRTSQLWELCQKIPAFNHEGYLQILLNFACDNNDESLIVHGWGMQEKRCLIAKIVNKNRAIRSKLRDLLQNSMETNKEEHNFSSIKNDYNSLFHAKNSQQIHRPVLLSDNSDSQKTVEQYLEQELIKNSYPSRQTLINCLYLLALEQKGNRSNLRQAYKETLRGLLDLDYFFHEGEHQRLNFVLSTLIGMEEQPFIVSLCQSQQSLSAIMVLAKLHSQNLTPSAYEFLLQQIIGCQTHRNFCTLSQILGDLLMTHCGDQRVMKCCSSLYERFKQIYDFKTVIYSDILEIYMIPLLTNQPEILQDLMQKIWRTDCDLFTAKHILYAKQNIIIPSHSPSPLMQEFVITPSLLIGQWLNILKSDYNGAIETIQKNMCFTLRSTMQLWDKTLTFVEVTDHNPQCVKISDSNFYRNHRFQYYSLEIFKVLQKGIVSDSQNIYKIVECIKDVVQRHLSIKSFDITNGTDFYQTLNIWKFIYAACSHEVLLVLREQKLLSKLLSSMKGMNRHPLIRQYVQVVFCQLYLSATEEEQSQLRNQMIKILQSRQIDLSVYVPILLTLGYEMVNKEEEEKKEEQRILQEFVRLISCHQAYVRSIAQYYIMKVVEKRGGEGLIGHLAMKVWKEDKDCIKIMRNIGIAVEGFKQAVEAEDKLEFLGFERVEEYPSSVVTLQLHRDIYDILSHYHTKIPHSHPMKPTISTKIDRLSTKIKQQSQNQELSHLSLQIQKPEVIILATLLEKVHNFGHILRTMHELGKKVLLVVPSKTPITHPECQELIPRNSKVRIIEIKENELLQFIALQKKCGYPMIALEQCSGSVKIEDFRFPGKYMLLLGNERKGASAKFLNQADVLVEIPQVGKVRSLNVHVSMAICVWQSLSQ